MFLILQILNEVPPETVTYDTEEEVVEAESTADTVIKLKRSRGRAKLGIPSHNSPPLTPSQISAKPKPDKVIFLNEAPVLKAQDEMSLTYTVDNIHASTSSKSGLETEKVHWPKCLVMPPRTKVPQQRIFSPKKKDLPMLDAAEAVSSSLTKKRESITEYYHCLVCDFVCEVIPEKSTVIADHEKVHRQPTEGRQCPYCHVKFKSEEVLRKHMKNAIQKTSDFRRLLHD